MCTKQTNFLTKKLRTMYMGINWKNVDLTQAYNRDQNIIDPKSFESLLLEIECNLSVINEDTVQAHFDEILEATINTAREVMKDNLTNIVKYAQKDIAKR